MSFNAKRKTPWYPPEFNEEFKEGIRKRDRNRCAICERKMQKLDIHHIDYTKYTVPQNCISLCRDCHSVLHAQNWAYKNRMMYYLQKIAFERELALA